MRPATRCRLDAGRGTEGAAPGPVGFGVRSGPASVTLLVLTVRCLIAVPGGAAQTGQQGLSVPDPGADSLWAPSFEEVRAPARHALHAIRKAWVDAVAEESAIEPGLVRLAALRRTGGVAEPLLLAYEGAFSVLRGKHAFMPRAKWRHVQDGLAVLDRAVTMAPDHAEVRYVRLMSAYYLPFFFNRGETVQADLSALARLLLDVRDDYPAAWYEGVVRFVVEKGDVAPDRRAALLEALDGAGGGAGAGSSW